VTIAVNPNTFASQKGTVVATITVRSASAVNIPPTVRVLINTKDPDQRGTFIDIPGKLVDLLSDSARNRYYVLRQDKNQVLVFDGTSNQQIGVLRTGNTPTSMAMTFDNQLLMIGHDDSQVAYVYDLNTLQPQLPIVMPFGHYPRSLAASGNAILAAVRSASGPHAVDRIDLPSRRATMLPTLGVFQNTVHLNTVLAPAPNGATILLASADGNVMLYDANADTFTASRKDLPALGGSSPPPVSVSTWWIIITERVAGSDQSSIPPTARLRFAFVDRAPTARRPWPPALRAYAARRPPSGGGIAPAWSGIADRHEFCLRARSPLAAARPVALTVSGVTVLPGITMQPWPAGISQLVNAMTNFFVAPGGLSMSWK
jgi:hypothetical protein